MASLPLTGQPQSRGKTRIGLLAAVALALLILAVWVNLRVRSGAGVMSHLQAGIQSLHAGQTERAEQEWRTALTLDPRRPEPYHLLGELYVETDRPAQAIPLLKRLYDLAPHSEHVLCYLAEAYALDNQSSQALDTARLAVMKEPGCPRAHAMLGMLLGDQLDHVGAVTELSKATALAPGDDKIALSLAEAQLDAADLNGAEQTAQKVIAHAPNYARAYYVLGWSRARRTPTPDTLRGATQAFEKLVQLDPSRTDAYAEIGRLRSLAGDNRGAVTALETAWKSGQHSEEVAFNLANAYRKVGEAGKADQMTATFKMLSDYQTKYEALRKTLAVSPHNLNAMQQMADLEIHSGNYMAAAPLLQELLRERPQDKQALLAAEQLYLGLGEKQRAAAMQQRIAAFPTAQGKEAP